MRDSGRDRDPAGCEVSRGCPAGKRAHLGSPSAEKLLTEEPSCEAEDMTAPTTHATPKLALDQRAPSRHDNASSRDSRSLQAETSRRADNSISSCVAWSGQMSRKTTEAAQK